MKNRLLNYVLYNYLKKIKSKAFIIFNICLVLASVLLSQLPNIIGSFNQTFDYEEVIVVVDKTNTYAKQFTKDLKMILPDLIVKEAAEVTDELSTQVQDGDLIAYFEIDYTEDNLLTGSYTANDFSNMSLFTSGEQILSNYNSEIAMTSANLTPEQVELLQRPFELEMTALDNEAPTADEVMGSFATAYFAVLAIFMFSYMYSVYAGQEVMYEKTSRVMEIIVTSIPPIKQLYGKIIYNSLYALTQLTLIIVLFTIGLQQMMKSLPDEVIELSESLISTSQYQMIMYFILFAIVAYLVYLVSVLILSSIISSVEEYQIAIAPIMIIGLISFYIGIFGISFVDSPFIKCMSFVPFFSVYIMPLRIAASTASTLEIWLSLGLNMAIFFLILIFGANVYKNGVLNYSGDSGISKFKNALKKQ